MESTVIWIVGDRVEVRLQDPQHPLLGDIEGSCGRIEDLLPSLDSKDRDGAAWVRLDSGELVGLGLDRLTRIDE